MQAGGRIPKYPRKDGCAPDYSPETNGNNQGRGLSVNWGGGCIFIYLCYDQLISFEISCH